MQQMTLQRKHVFKQCVIAVDGYVMFFNLFSEGEPFAAILIAHGTHVFWGVS